ncbi:MAG: TlpA family protein disulfide reductase [Dehalococcoidia bacterium]
MEELEIESVPLTEEEGSFWRRRWKVLLPLLLSLSALVAIMAWGMLNQSPVTGKSGFTRIGKPAPDFTIASFSGETVSLSDYRGSPVVVNFWASWCGPCRLEAPVLERVWRRFELDGVMFLGVNIQDLEKDARAYIREFDITYPNGPDDTGLTTIDYGVGGIPVTFFIDRDGVVARRYVGALKESRLIAWTEELLAGAPPSGEVESENLEDFFEFDE